MRGRDPAPGGQESRGIPGKNRRGFQLEGWSTGDPVPGPPSIPLVSRDNSRLDYIPFDLFVFFFQAVSCTETSVRFYLMQTCYCLYRGSIRGRVLLRLSAALWICGSVITVPGLHRWKGACFAALGVVVPEVFVGGCPESP